MNNDYIKKHNFNYGNSSFEKDSVINKLKLRTTEDLMDYLKEALEDLFINAKLVGDIMIDFSYLTYTQIIIEKI